MEVFGADSYFCEGSRQAMRVAHAQGALVACEVVWAEVAATFADRTPTAEALTTLGVDFSPIDAMAAVEAGAMWRRYLRSGGTRDRIVADFLIASHAQLRADRLLSPRSRVLPLPFSGLTVVDPSA